MVQGWLETWRTGTCRGSSVGKLAGTCKRSGSNVQNLKTLKMHEELSVSFVSCEVVASPENRHRAYCHLIDSHRRRSIHTRVVHRGVRAQTQKKERAPNWWEARRVEARKVGARRWEARRWGAKNSRLFFPFFWWSSSSFFSLEVFSWNFGGVFEGRGPSNVHVWALDTTHNTQHTHTTHNAHTQRTHLKKTIGLSRTWLK